MSQTPWQAFYPRLASQTGQFVLGSSLSEEANRSWPECGERRIGVCCHRQTAEQIPTSYKLFVVAWQGAVRSAACFNAGGLHAHGHSGRVVNGCT